MKNLLKIALVLMLLTTAGCTILDVDTDISNSYTLKFAHSEPYLVMVYSKHTAGIRDGVDRDTGESLYKEDLSITPSDHLITDSLLSYNLGSFGWGTFTMLGSVKCFSCLDNATIFFISVDDFPTEKSAVAEAKRQHKEAYKKVLEEYAFKYPLNKETLPWPWSDGDGFQSYYRRVKTGDDVSSFTHYCYEDKGECFDNSDFYQTYVDDKKHFKYGSFRAISKGEVKFLDNKSMWVITDDRLHGGMFRHSDQKKSGFDPIPFYLSLAKHLPDNAYLKAVNRYTGIPAPIVFNKGQPMDWTTVYRPN